MTHKILAASSVALMGAGSLLGATAAQAYTSADCGTQPIEAVTEIVDGNICQVTFNIPDDYLWYTPEGVDHISAIIIGGGAAASTLGYGYGGGAGEVYFSDNVYPVDEGFVALQVGAGGTAVGGGDQDGEDSILEDSANFIVASGGLANGTSGSGYTAGTYSDGWTTFGGGAKNGGTSTEPGEGFLTSETGFDPASDLFPANVDNLILGRGGSGLELPDQGGYGWGGSADGGGDIEDGYDGAVIFRWFVPESASNTPLASTGVDAAPMGFAAAAMLVAGGVGLAIARRARRTK